MSAKHVNMYEQPKRPNQWLIIVLLLLAVIVIWNYCNQTNSL